MIKNLYYILILFCVLNSYSQGKFIYNPKVNTRDIILNEYGNEILFEKSLILETTEKFKSKSIFNHNIFNFKVDETGKITFIKGHKGFAKINVPEELVGVHIPPYDDDEVIKQLNELFSEYKLVHFINLEKQADCKKLKNVLFYGRISLNLK